MALPEGDRPAVEAALGGQWDWHRLVPAAWQAAALPAAPAPMLRRTGPEELGRLDPLGRSYAEASYWTALVHLLVAGLGWTRLDLGLERWLRAGMPTEDPVLAAAARGWGPHLEEFTGWLCDQVRGVKWERDVLNSDLVYRHLDDPAPNRPLRVPDAGVHTWHSDWDGLHLAGHLQAWLGQRPHPDTRVLDDARVGPGGKVLIVPTYAGWRAALDQIAPRTADGRSVRVEVWCQPVGWLGVYRNSQESGVWFRGRHRWHVLGA